MSRQSSIFKSSSAANTPSSVRHQRNNDPFPLLDLKEIVVCLESCSFTCSEELLMKPTQQYMLTLFSQIADTFLNINDLKLYNIMNRLEDDQSTFNESLNIIGLQKIIYRFLNECGIDDFNIMDIVKPDPIRVRRILSCIVNFARFREEHKFIIEKFNKLNRDILGEYEKLVQVNLNLKDKINSIKSNIMQNNLDKLNQLNSDLEAELKNLKKTQESLTLQHDNYKTEKKNLLKNYENNSYLLLENEKQLNNLKNYVIEKPDIVAKINCDLNNSIETNSKILENLEKKSRNLSITIDSFNFLQQDFKNFNKNLEDIQIEISKKNQTNSKLVKYKEIIEEKKINLNNLNRNFEQLNRKLKNNNEKIEKLKLQSTEKQKNFNKNIENLHKEYTTLLTERNLDEQNLINKKNTISSYENKIDDLNFKFDEELKEINLEISKLNNHIRLYLNEMNKKF
ncbi:hypothetical protein PACTADRAFT_1801 [Pachysolen tannophilus NRRL Y-2460]|uniref:Uncharacterized protein n=1 Tax=Pachysolen tannophilus NRRL Y-2460 TaxID=669874 RepID=A0A1E4TZX7_PACTA|nr:hypothetical protein PACTADRAFT_1801 [Pachysolen tannophilus NRRL Y-2460]